MKIEIAKLPKSCRESGQIYAEALAEACGTVDPVKVLTDTDMYPKIVKKIELAEFIVGWFHGVGETLGVLPETLWEAFAPAAAPEPPKARKAKPEPVTAKPAPEAKAPKAKAPKAKAPKAKAKPKAAAPVAVEQASPITASRKRKAKPAASRGALEETLAGMSAAERRDLAMLALAELRDARAA